MWRQGIARSPDSPAGSSGIGAQPRQASVGSPGREGHVSRHIREDSLDLGPVSEDFVGVLIERWSGLGRPGNGHPILPRIVRRGCRGVLIPRQGALIVALFHVGSASVRCRNWFYSSVFCSVRVFGLAATGEMLAHAFYPFLQPCTLTRRLGIGVNLQRTLIQITAHR